MTRPLVLTRLDPGPGWVGYLPDPLLLSPDDLPDNLEGYDSVWVDGALKRPLDVVRHVRTRDAAVQAIVVAPPEDRGIHERALLFTPGVGEVWVTAPDDVGEELMGEARELTRTRRGYRITRERLNRALEGRSEYSPARAIVSDAYLAALLQVLPDPVVSLDDDGRVASWSDAAEDLLGIARTRALGQPIRDVISPEDADALERALEDGRVRTVKTQVCLAPDGRRIFTETLVTPVEVGGMRVRTLVVRDVTEERRARERLRQAIELRSRFYAAMSHEIRTPINAIMGYNELLRTGAGGEEKRDEYLARSQRAANHLLELVNDVLDLSKLESGGLELEPEPVPVAHLLHDLIETLEPLAQERSTPLESECSDRVTITTDPRRLKQILMNLVSNAIKFGEGRPVRVRCSSDGDRVRFDVEDQGVGIAPEDHDRIFQEFTQVQGTEGGTGLGLPISRKLAELLGGELTLESERGHGSRFTVLIPARNEVR